MREDRDCTLTVHYLPAGDGTVIEAYSCEPDTAPAPGELDTYTNETLLSLSYSNARAAETLGMRLREDDPELALSLIIRASALTGGDVRPIQLYSNSFPTASSVNGQPVAETIRIKYVLSAVAELLGAQDNNLKYWDQRVRAMSANADQAVAEFDRQAITIVDQMQAIEREVKGESAIRGGSDNA